MKFIFKYLISIIVFLLICETVTRVFFPIFSENNIYYKENDYFRVSKGKKTYFKEFNKLLVRVKNPEVKLIFKENKTIWFIGDSVTNGYGVKFEDTYYSHLNQNLKNENLNFNIFASGMYGNNYVDNLLFAKNLSEILSKKDFVIYQFNYNDLIDIGSQRLKFSDKDIPSRSFLMKLINSTNKFRYKYLNYSSFFQLLQHHASIIVRNTEGSCFERGLDALGPYTYAFFADGYQNKSKLVWDSFKKDILKIKKIFSERDINFLILIVPISIQLNKHKKINKLNYDIKCSNIDPRKYLTEFLKRNNINLIDTTDYFLKFENNFKENLFHSFDTNHPNENGHKLISQSIKEELINNYLNQ